MFLTPKKTVYGKKFNYLNTEMAKIKNQASE